jgi:hypothetical protein
MMNKVLSISIAIIISAVFTGCGSTPQPNSNSASNTNAVVNSNGTGGNTTVPANSIADQQIPGITGPANAETMDPNSTPAGNVEMANRRRPIDVPNGTVGPAPSVPAPDNSSVSTTMGKDGSFIETRTFTGDKDISKVVRISDGRTQTVNIYLKSGRTVSVDPSKIKMMTSVPISTFKDLAGIKPPPPPKYTEKELEKMRKEKEMKKAGGDQ